MLDNLVDSLDNSLDTKPQVMSREIVMLSNNIPDLRNNASGFKEHRDFWGDGPQEQQECGSKKVDDDEDVRISAVKDRKIATIIANTKCAVEKLLMAPIKIALMEDRQDVSVKKIWIENPS